MRSFAEQWKSMIELNKGIRIGGPFDGTEHSVLIYPGEYPNDTPPPEVAEVSRVFNITFPEGAVYHWNAEKQEWHYKGQMPEQIQNESMEMFHLFGMKPAPPL